ncbi:phage tail family protein [Pseudobacillus sp. 179-B 2D1 NHS]|uniref:phage tail family protein n=1 Tax=Pseudobacillus sp. 179-B 2D1 NHS TaxID=3374292 RepID=UPI00387A23FC
MERLIFTSVNGEVIRFDGPPFYLSKVNGLGDVEAETQLQKAPYQDGSILLDSVLGERTIPIEFLIVQDDGYHDVSASRIQIAKAFNPKLGLGTLRYENDHIVREIKAVADSVPVYPDGPRTERIQKGLINLICPDPYWRSLNVTEEPAFEPLFQFPFEGEFQMGVQRDRRIITNDGDAPAPLQIEFFGPALNPIIMNNTTGEFIKVNQELLEGEVMKIDTSDSSKSVVFVGVDGTERNVFNWIDLNSTFFKLVIGENDIEYTADSDIQGAIVNIRYSKLYTAV